MTIRLRMIRMILVGPGLAGLLLASSCVLVGGTADAQPTRSPSILAAGRRDPVGQFNTTDLTVARDEILSGGPAKDGIPTLTDPKVVRVEQAGFLKDGDRIISVTIGDATRGYPVGVLNWHEAINDTLGDVPIAVVYCPLCDSVTVVNRRIDARTLEFGISGLLQNSNVLLYDRTDNALWSQIGLRAISGPHAGHSLRHLPWEITTFASFRKRYPKATVVTDKTGYRRDYGRNPYESYFRTDRLMFPVAHRDGRLSVKMPVVGIRWGGVTRAYPVAAIQNAPSRTFTDELAGHRVVLRADETGGVRVVEVPPGSQVAHTFWFAWAAFHPKTQVLKQPVSTVPSAEARPSQR